MIPVTMAVTRRAVMKPFNVLYNMLNQNSSIVSRKIVTLALFLTVLSKSSRTLQTARSFPDPKGQSHSLLLFSSGGKWRFDLSGDIMYLFEDHRKRPIRYLQTFSKKYCNYPPQTGNDEGFLNLPGVFADNPFKLKMVQVLIRHGDRAPVLLYLPNADKKLYNCSVGSNNLVIAHLFSELKEMVKYLKFRKLSSEVSEHSFLPDLQVKACRAGQLTAQGFLQLIAIGKHLRRQYSNLLDDLQGDQITVRATNSDRTVQSAAALLCGLLTEEGAIRAKSIVVNVTTDPWFRQKDDGSMVPCPALHKVKARNKQSPLYVKGAQDLEEIMQQFSKVLDIPRTKLPTITSLADQVLTRSCHKYPLPCGPRGCITEKDAGEIYRGAVWSYRHNYSAPAQLLMHPLLTQFTDRMIMVSKGKTRTKFVLYAGHDSTLTPLLLFMGLFEHDWLHYATRIVFELWDKNTSKHLNVGSASPLKDLMIRVLLNGKAVTHKVNFCRNKLLYEEFCPAEELLKVLSKTGPGGMEKYFKELCAHEV